MRTTTRTTPATTHAAPDPDTRADTRADTLVAAFAGPLAWRAETHDRSVTQFGAMLATIVFASAQAITVVIVTLWNPDGVTSRALGVGAAACLVSLSVVVGHAALVLRRTVVPVSTIVLVGWRVILLALFSIGWFSIVSGPGVLLMWPIGLYLGSEIALTGMLLGGLSAPGVAARRILLSPTHLGVLSAGVIGAFVAGGEVRSVAVDALVAVEVTLGLAVGSFALITTVWHREQHRDRELVEAERSRERTRRAHWLHDDVCADLRVTRMRLAAGPMSIDQVAAELDELDHRMRDRQLDELLDGGSVTAVQVLQPTLRKAQDAGILLADVPRYEQASIRIDAAAARVLRRVVGGLVANAMAAGATTLSIRLRPDGEMVELDVEDDAGGFDLAEVPAGRGLSTIAADTGGRLVVERTASGSRVTATIPIGAVVR
jgi:signal transduction histidine kinase